MASQQSLPTFSPDMLTRMEPGMLTDEMKEGKTQQHNTPIVLLDAGRFFCCAHRTAQLRHLRTIHDNTNYTLNTR